MLKISPALIFFIWSISASALDLAGIRAIIFDCDGVLVDSEYQKYCAWQQVLIPYHLDFTLEDYMPMVGYSPCAILSMISKLKGVDLPPCVIDSRDVIYVRLQHEHVFPISGMVLFVRKLACLRDQLSIKLGLASSPSRKEILFNVERIGLVGVFDVIISGEEDLGAYGEKHDTNKPKPYIYQEAAYQLDVLPEHCLVFEDTAAGVAAAASAGMHVIAVPNRYTINQDFSRAEKIISFSAELFVSFEAR